MKLNEMPCYGAEIKVKRNYLTETFSKYLHCEQVYKVILARKPTERYDEL